MRQVVPFEIGRFGRGLPIAESQRHAAVGVAVGRMVRLRDVIERLGGERPQVQGFAGHPVVPQQILVGEVGFQPLPDQRLQAALRARIRTLVGEGGGEAEKDTSGT